MTFTADRPVVTRFAPSPTGALHIGGARTALFAWAYARGHHGKFILRLEDTDKKRSSVESARGIVRDLKWLGLNWDEGPSGDEGADPYADQVGDNGPYTQSQRAEQGLYDHYIALLLDAGEAYEDDGAVRLKMGAHRGDLAFDDAVFGRVEVKADDNEDFVIRKGVEGGRLPTFHFAVVCDDALMGVTHVIRGQEHLSNTTKHAAIYDALAKITADAVTWARPVWVHTPSIMNPGGSKMSKRDKAKAAREAAIDSEIDKDDLIDGAIRFDGQVQVLASMRTGESKKTEHLSSDIDEFLNKSNDDNRIAKAIAGFLGITLPEIEVDDFRRSGYLPGVCLNYIALLGWNPGNDVERFDLDFLCQHFDFNRVGKANSTFDRDKLRHFNGDTIRSLPADDFACLLADYVKAYRPDWEQAGVFNGDDWQTFCAAVQERTETLPDPLNANAYLIADDESIGYDFSPKPVRKAMTGSDGQGIKLLEALRVKFDTLPEENFGTAAHQAIEQAAEASGINMGKYAQPVRIAVSGGPVTPPIDVVLDLLGKSSTLHRIDRCLEQAKAHLATQK
ncbi:MAG: glutamate--tRNA ligase [Phycisphaeraceae bacterium]